MGFKLPYTYKMDRRAAWQQGEHIIAIPCVLIDAQRVQPKMFSPKIQQLKTVRGKREKEECKGTHQSRKAKGKEKGRNNDLGREKEREIIQMEKGKHEKCD